jgi:hypothetical protein
MTRRGHYPRAASLPRRKAHGRVDASKVVGIATVETLLLPIGVIAGRRIKKTVPFAAIIAPDALAQGDASLQGGPSR